MARKKTVTVEPSPSSLSLAIPDGIEILSYKAEVIDSLRHMASRLRQSGPIPACLALVSALPEEGVTYLSRAWGLTIANDLRLKVCVVELNWWKPDRTQALIEKSSGLVAVLHGEANLKDVIVSTSEPNLHLIPAGSVEIVERPILARSQTLKMTLDKLAKQYDHLVLDLPALRVTNDAIPLAALADAVCMVIHQKATTVDNARLALDDISLFPVIGVILNKSSTSTPPWIMQFIPQDPTRESGN